MLPWPAISPDISPTEHIWDITGGQLQDHPKPALTGPVLTDQVVKSYGAPSHNLIPGSCIQNSGVNRLLMLQYFILNWVFLRLH